MNPKPPKQQREAHPKSHHQNSLAANQVPRPVSAFPRLDKAGYVIARHSHERDQLLYAIRGVMTIQAQDSIWTIPPSHGLWVPAYVEHSVRMDTEVEMRTLYFQPGIVAGVHDKCQVRAVTPLLRELILRAMTIHPLYDLEGPDGRLMQLIIDEIGQLEPEPLSLRLPKDRRLARLCNHLLDTLGENEPIGRLGAKVGLSERSIIRLFPIETGLTLHRWRQQARLMRAFALAERGKNISVIAADLGYSSPSAFAKMFRKIFGRAPREIFLSMS